MAVRNGERWLEIAARSVLTQTLSDFEFIVVDDGSTDRSPDILAALASGEPRLCIVRQGPQGLVRALNRALDLAQGPLVARLDADDVALPDRLARQVSYFAEHADLALLGTWAEKIDALGNRIGRLTPEHDPPKLTKLLGTLNPFVHSSVMMDAALAREVGGYREVCKSAEDYDLWLRLSERGTIANLPETLVRYRWHSDNATLKDRTRQAFSVRLAQHASGIRRASGRDPIASISGPPDWWAPQSLNEFYCDDARLYRFLDAATVHPLSRKQLDAIQLPGRSEMARLSHVERRLTRRAVIALLVSPDRPPKLSHHGLVSLLMASFLPRGKRTCSNLDNAYRCDTS
jgi:glycosyltransferase involved in cell wall biosynthesis